MAIVYEKIKNWPFPPVEHDYKAKDCMLYALGVGLGADPLDAQQLRFVYEDGLQMLPTMPVVLAGPGFWAINPETGINWKAILHGEIGLTIVKPLPVQGCVVGKTSILEVVDKGEGKGALIYTKRDIVDKASGEVMAVVTSTSFCRADGGFGGPSGPVNKPHPVPDRACDASCALPTLPQAALIYRLSGDYNPLHADPAVAAVGGFKAPILHGLCTYGVAGHAIVKTLCGYDGTKLRRLDARFSSPVYPGETIRTDMWNEGPGKAAFRCFVVERNVMVLDNGRAEFTA
ncbi:MAG: MaoC/PaaZ C-terminal domain-containing protein [Burkholderiaceae bacterium]